MARLYWLSGLVAAVAWALAIVLFGPDLLQFAATHLSADGRISNGPLVLLKLSLALFAAWLLLPVAWRTWRPAEIAAGWRAAGTLARFEVVALGVLLLAFLVARARWGAFTSLAAPGWLGADTWHGEDGPFESMTAASAIAAAGLLAVSAVRTRWWARWLLVALAAAAFGFGMEEISWGQRIFGIHGHDAIVSRNWQGETNLHNFLAPRLVHLYLPAVICTAAAAWFCFADRLAALLPDELRPLSDPPHRLALSVGFQLLALQSALNFTGEIAEESIAVLLLLGALRLRGAQRAHAHAGAWPALRARGT